MTGKEFLKQIRDINITIIALQREIENINTLLTNTTIRPKEVDVQTSIKPDPMADKIIQKVEYEDKLRECISKQIKIKEDALLLLDELESHGDKGILMLRYINCMTMKELEDAIDKKHTIATKKLREAEKAFNALYELKRI